MSGAEFILAINLVVAGLLSAAFMTIGVYDQKLNSARWMALAYLLGMAGSAIEFAIKAMGSDIFAVVLSFGVFLAATTFFNAGLADKFRVRTPWPLMAAVFAGSLVVCYAIQELPRESFGRMLAYQAPYFLMQMIGVFIVWSARARRRRLDTLMMAVLCASALQFLSKPFLSHALGGTGATPSDYLHTNYALFSQTMTTLFAMGIALLMLVILVRDILTDVTVKSETDVLSGLLNRAGFEHYAAATLDKAERQGVPLSMVIADLDHFKTVNDTYGHASGDLVIRAFAGFVRSAASGHHVAARLGGEEFAIILPGTNLVAARLFAEGARSAFSALPIDGLPVERRFTASFGVAELYPGESISALMRRADEALYEAKNSGRDCVRMAVAPLNRRSVLGSRAG